MGAGDGLQGMGTGWSNDESALSPMLRFSLLTRMASLSPTVSFVSFLHTLSNILLPSFVPPSWDLFHFFFSFLH